MACPQSLFAFTLPSFNFSFEPFLILATGLLINATNYIDGVDGLLLTFFACCLGYYIFLIEDTNTIYLIKLLLIPVILNLILNLLPFKSKIKFFSGNSGSLFVGFFVQKNAKQPYHAISQPYQGHTILLDLWDHQ